MNKKTIITSLILAASVLSLQVDVLAEEAAPAAPAVAVSAPDVYTNLTRTVNYPKQIETERVTVWTRPADQSADVLNLYYEIVNLDNLSGGYRYPLSLFLKGETTVRTTLLTLQDRKKGYRVGSYKERLHDGNYFLRYYKDKESKELLWEERVIVEDGKFIDPSAPIEEVTPEVPATPAETAPTVAETPATSAESAEVVSTVAETPVETGTPEIPVATMETTKVEADKVETSEPETTEQPKVELPVPGREVKVVSTQPAQSADKGTSEQSTTQTAPAAEKAVQAAAKGGKFLPNTGQATSLFSLLGLGLLGFLGYRATKRN